MSTRERRSNFQEEHGVEVSADRVSRMTDAVLDEVETCRNQPLQALYPSICTDALVQSVRDEGLVSRKGL